MWLCGFNLFDKLVFHFMIANYFDHHGRSTIYISQWCFMRFVLRTNIYGTLRCFFHSLQIVDNQFSCTHALILVSKVYKPPVLFLSCICSPSQKYHVRKKPSEDSKEVSPNVFCSSQRISARSPFPGISCNVGFCF